MGGGIPICAKTAINSVLLSLKKENKAKYKLLAKYIDGKIDIESVNKSKLIKAYDNSWKA